MSVIIGIDVGGSTTKIVGFRKGESPELIEPQFVRANDPITATYGAFGKFTDENKIAMSDIDKIMITGVGSSYVKSSLYGLECVRVPEFSGTGRGGLYVSGLDRALVVSMGTGTAMVHANADGRMDYLGGTGVGGGTLLGLSRLILSADTVSHIEEYAETGDLKNVDLRIGDITAQGKSSVLPRDLTASNFGNLSDLATKEDLSLGILNMVYETVGMISVFAARSVGVENIVLTGNLTRLAFCRQKFDFFNSMKDTYGMSFIIPKRSEYATVIGTAIHGL
jgi:type II pantothenate kinase